MQAGGYEVRATQGTILHLFAKLTKNGPAIVGVELLTRLRDAGCPVEVASGGGELAEVLGVQGVPHHSVAFSAGKWGLLRLIPETLKLISVIQARNVRILHIHHTRRAGLVAPLVKWLTGVQVVHTIQNELDPLKRGDRCLTFADHFIAVSAAIQGQLVRNYKVDAERTSVIWNFVNTTDFTPEGCRGYIRSELGLTEQTIVLTCVARLDPQKGHLYLLQALPLLVRQYPQVVLLIVGEGQLHQELQDTAASLGVSDHVLFLGFRSDIPCILQDTDVFVLPSLWEGLSIALIEAMAAGKPVVATAVSGTPEVVLDGITGLLVRPRDPNDLAEKLLALVSDTSLASRLGKEAEDFVLQRIEPSRIIAETLKVYDRLVPGVLS